MDDIVVFGEDGLGRGLYQKGRVLELFHGKDGVARSAKVWTVSGSLYRPVAKLAKLDLEGDNVG